jgi:hypothetical protein
MTGQVVGDCMIGLSEDERMGELRLIRALNKGDDADYPPSGRQQKNLMLKSPPIALGVRPRARHWARRILHQGLICHHCIPEKGSDNPPPEFIVVLAIVFIILTIIVPISKITSRVGVLF